MIPVNQEELSPTPLEPIEQRQAPKENGRLRRTATNIGIGMTALTASFVPSSSPDSNTQLFRPPPIEQSSVYDSFHSFTETVLGSKELVIMNANMGEGQYLLGQSGTDIEPMKNLIRKEEPDIVGFQEVEIDDIPEFTKLGYGAIFVTLSKYPGRNIGIALLYDSDYELDESETKAFHIYPDDGFTSKRMAISVTLKTRKGESFRVVVTHLSPLLAEPPSKRLIEIIEGDYDSDGQPENEKATLLLADLNRAEDQADKMLGLEKDPDLYTDEAAATYPAVKPTQAIDRVIFFRPTPFHQKLYSATAKPIKSDHRALIEKYGINNPSPRLGPDHLESRIDQLLN